MRFDLILVLGYFRSATAYLSVIRHLAPRLRVGLIPAAVDPSFVLKNQRAQQTFLTLCEKFGAEILYQGTPVEADVMLVQQFPYPEETAAEIMNSVSAAKRVGLMALAMAGIEKHDSFLKCFEIQKVYVPSKRFMKFLLRRRNAEDRYTGIKVVEVGLPFGRHQVFSEFEADYLIAAPTTFSFHTERGKQGFLRTVLRLLNQIPESDVVVYKPHNGMGRDYFAPAFHYTVARWLLRIPGGRRLSGVLARAIPGRLRAHWERVETGILHLQVLERALPLGKVTPYAETSLEAFLPGVRKGVIGGLSNTIWGTLYLGLPFYNCVAGELRQGASEEVKRRSGLMLDLNLQYFGVPYCGGDLGRGARGEEIVTQADRQGDLLMALEADITTARCAA